jgi:hypothetical protein
MGGVGVTGRQEVHRRKKDEARGAGRHEGKIQEFFTRRQIIIP